MAEVVGRFAVGPCTATLFVNQVKTDGVRVTAFFSVGVQRTYRDREGRMQTTASFRPHDVPKLVLALQRAYEHWANQPEPASDTKREARPAGAPD